MTLDNDNEARLRSAISSLGEIKGSGADCPDAELIYESATGKLSRSEDRDVVAHIGECGSCSTAWRLARELAGDEIGVTPAVPSSAWKRWVPAVAAASLIFAAVWIGVSQFERPGEKTPVYREQQEDWLAPAMKNDESVTRDACVLRWTPGPEGTNYDLLVMDENLQPLARARWLDRPNYAIVPGDLAGLPPGGSVLWRITAHLPDGRRVVSRTFTTKLE